MYARKCYFAMSSVPNRNLLDYELKDNYFHACTKTQMVELVEVTGNTKTTKTSYTKRNHWHKRNSLSLLRAYGKQSELSFIQAKLKAFQTNLIVQKKFFVLFIFFPSLYMLQDEIRRTTCGESMANPAARKQS